LRPIHLVEPWTSASAGTLSAAAGEIGVARFGGDHVAHHHMTDARGLDTIPLDRFAHGGGRQLRRRDVLQRAAEGADGGSRRGDDKDLTSSDAVSCEWVKGRTQVPVLARAVLSMLGAAAAAVQHACQHESVRHGG
jgi:hypothetical protein